MGNRPIIDPSEEDEVLLRRLGRGFFGAVYQVEKKLGIDTCLDMNVYAARVAKRCQYNVELEVFNRTHGLRRNACN